jgi:dihydrofolate synthase / folylpolyglutamate synthase
MSDYIQTLEKLFYKNFSRGIVLNIEVPLAISKVLGHPEKKFSIVHVAGSNGKGSVSTKIAHSLFLAGYKVGLFTSPHLFSFRERILLQEQMIPEKEVEEILNEVTTVCEKEGIDATFFEIMTFVAFEYYRRQNIDVAVLEAGLGGRLDATNVVMPVLSVITSISKEHTMLLGSTEEEIAIEKAGIIKQGVPVVLGRKAIRANILAKAQELRCPVFQCNEEAGWYDQENQQIAKAALQVLTPLFPKVHDHIETGIRIRPSCRFERKGHFIFDVAHNPDAFERLFEAIQREYPQKKMSVILGMSNDKDIMSCLKTIICHASRIYLVEGATPRAVKKDVFSSMLRSLSFTAFQCEDSVTRAIQKAQEDDSDLKIICGSFYIMAEAKQALGENVSLDPFYLNEAGHVSVMG